MAVPAIPLRIASAICTSLRSACHANDDSSRGSRERLTLIGPFDAPPIPWHDAQRCSQSPSPVAIPPASGPRSVLSQETMLHRSSALSASANAAICVPAIPTDTIRYMSAGGTSRITSALPNAGGGGTMPPAGLAVPHPPGAVAGGAMLRVEPGSCRQVHRLRGEVQRGVGA